MKIVMLGTGYVGLVTGACFSEFGYDVICVDKDREKINNLENGILPIYEPGLEILVKKNYKNGKLKFSNSIEKSISDADAIFIAVGTPERRGDGHADLTYVYAVAKEIAPILKKYCVVITKSTIPVGTSLEIRNIIKKHNRNASFDVVSNPEFLREGSAIEDFMRPNRVIIGCKNEKSKKIIENSLEEIKAQNTIFLDLSKLNSFTDFLVITTGTSSRHMSAIKDKLLEDLKRNKISINGVEGQDSSEWILMDLGNFVVNIMSKDSRKLYDLESLWDPALN